MSAIVCKRKSKSDMCNAPCRRRWRRGLLGVAAAIDHRYSETNKKHVGKICKKRDPRPIDRRELESA
jgi:hypothetical protein